MKLREAIPETNPKTERDINFGEHTPAPKSKKKMKAKKDDKKEFESPLPKDIRNASLEGY
jgi:hypothetical protein